MANWEAFPCRPLPLFWTAPFLQLEQVLLHHLSQGVSLLAPLPPVLQNSQFPLGTISGTSEPDLSGRWGQLSLSLLSGCQFPISINRSKGTLQILWGSLRGGHPVFTGCSPYHSVNVQVI